MHRSQCVIRRGRDCLLGEPGHCKRCPHRGVRGEPRYVFLQRVLNAAYSVERGFPPDKVEDDVAAVLWPAKERDWIEREGEWVKRARYWAAMAQGDLMRDLLREVYDLRSGRLGR